MKLYDSASATELDVSLGTFMHRQLDLKSRWHELRSIGSSRVAILTILTPVVGYLLIFNMRIPFFQQDWKVYSFYIGSVLFSIGTLTYAAICPGECKKYDTAVEYTNAEADFFTANWNIMVKMTRRNIEKHRWPKYFSIDQKDSERIIKELENSGNHLERKTHMIVLMDRYWHTLNPTKPQSRYLCFLCYSLGGGLIAVPGLWTAGEVIVSLFDFWRTGGGR